MRGNNLVRLAIILVLMLLSAYLVAPFPKPDFVKNLVFWQPAKGRDLQIKQGLDLKGGLQVLLASDLPGGAQPTADQMDSAKRIIEDRVNGLGVAEPVVQAAQDNRILVELPGVNDRNLAIDLIKQTGQLEFVDGGFRPPADGSPISTSYSTYGGLIYSTTVPNGKAIDPVKAADGSLLSTAFTGSA